MATDVSTVFRDAARLFAPQKGADPGQVTHLTARLDSLAIEYRTEFGVDVTAIAGSGAAGGLAGGLAALGARLQPGFDLVADELDLRRHIGAADLVITGEGNLDATSLLGKAPVGVVRLCERLATPVVLVVGDIAAGVTPPAPAVALVAAFGRAAALHDTLRCVEAATADLLAGAHALS